MSKTSKRTPQGFFTGRIDNYVFYDRMGTPCVKRLTKNFHPERHFTATHLINQQRIRYLVSLYQALGKTRARESWRTAPKRPGQTGYNAFVSRNYAAFDAEEAVADHALLTPSDGTLRHPLDLRAEATGERTLTLGWGIRPDQLLGAKADRLRLLLMPDDGSYGIIVREQLSVRRADGQTTVTLAPEEGCPPFAYAYWESADGRRFSPTRFLLLRWPDPQPSTDDKE